MPQFNLDSHSVRHESVCKKHNIISLTCGAPGGGKGGSVQHNVTVINIVQISLIPYRYCVIEILVQVQVFWIGLLLTVWSLLAVMSWYCKILW